MQVLKEKCSNCGTTENLVNHHVKYFPEETVVLCRKCHKKEHTHKGKVRPTNFKSQIDVNKKSVNINDDLWQKLTLLKIDVKAHTLDQVIQKLYDFYLNNQEVKAQ
jgi:hypothetical protein